MLTTLEDGDPEQSTVEKVCVTIYEPVCARATASSPTSSAAASGEVDARGGMMTADLITDGGRSGESGGRLETAEES